MTVYVDNMYTVPMGEFRRMKMSHMIADTIEELHRMADAIGMKREWFQGDHYDVSISARKKAIKLGAQEISMRQCAAMTFLKERIGVTVTVTPEFASVVMYGQDFPLSEE